MGKNAIVGQSGGPTSVINASLAGVFESCKSRGADVVYGMCNGVAGLLEERVVDLSTLLTDDLDIELLKRTPSSFLGSCRYKLPDWHTDEAVYKKLFAILEKLDIGYFFYIGGNDSMDTIAKLSRYGAQVGSAVRFIGVPKTIDNDLWGTDMTFGFQSAVDIATNAIDCIHTTASSHGRVFIVEVMGHKVGWLTLHAGIAGGADIILIPEIPYDLNKVVKKIKERTKNGSRFSILAVAEGAISKEQAALSKKEYKKYLEERATKYQSVAYEIGAKIQEMTGQEIRVTVPGHMQRGGTPVPYDRVLSTRIGAHAADMIKNNEFGKLVVVKNNVITDIPLAESAGKLKYVDPQSDIVKEAKLIGISFGD